MRGMKGRDMVRRIGVGTYPVMRSITWTIMTINIKLKGALDNEGCQCTIQCVN